MKALSIKQPWAWLIVHGYKPVENRNWGTPFRGPLLIHASKTFDDDGYDWVRAVFLDVPLPDRSAFERGGIVGSARMIDCVTRFDSPWFFGQYGFIMQDATPCAFVPVRGQLGFFDVVLPEADGAPR